MTLLAAHGLVKRFGTTEALRGLTLELRPSELYGLVGPDGAGKTTALRLFMGLLAPQGGTLQVLDVDPLRGGTRFREALGYMPQQYSLYGDLSVDENLRFFARMFCLPRALYRERREELLHITRLARFGDRRADALSGGMYKKLALACALLPRPKLLLLDEPTNGVDPVSRRELWELLFNLVEDGMTVLVTTAYMDEAARCHRVGLLHRGQLLAECPPAELLAGFSERVLSLRAQGGADDLRRAEAFLETRAEVLATTSSGDALRALVRESGEATLTAALAALPVSIEQSPPDFEDVFLARTLLADDAEAAA